MGHHGDCLRRAKAYGARARRRTEPMAAIETPCNTICTVDPRSRLCIGCGRSLIEIEAWVRFTAAERARIMADLPRRLTLLRGLESAAAG
jgi:uncharacterized protein